MSLIGAHTADVHFVSLSTTTDGYEHEINRINASCRGLRVLVDLLDEDLSEQSDLVIHALNGIGSVFELQVR